MRENSLIGRIESKQKKTLNEFIAWCGGASNAARFLDVSPQVVSAWIARGRMSATMAAEAEIQSEGIFNKAEFRPDVIDWRI